MPKIRKPTPKEHDFTQTRDEWERSVFDNAVMFVVIKSLGRGVRERDEFGADRLQEAMDFSLAYKGPYGRRAILMACAATGRAITLDRALWPTWMTRYKNNRGETDAQKVDA